MAFTLLDAGPGLIPNGTDQRLTVDNTVGGVPFGAFPPGTTHVLVTTEAADARYTLDTSAPTTTNGVYLASGKERVWHIAMVLALKAIRTGAISAVWHASPLKQA